MRTVNWKQNSRRIAGRANAGHRALAGLLALVMALGLVNFALPEASAADAKDYEAEKEARKTAYADKFDIANLKWAENGKDASGETVNHGNSARTYMCWQYTNDTFGGIVHKNYIHVYAFEGETITFGSSICDSTLTAEGTAVASTEQIKDITDRLGEGATVDIVLIDLHGNRILYDVEENDKGHIPNYQTEVLAKTMEEVTGNKGEVGGISYTYTPLTYEVRETGVYTFEFHSYDGKGFGGTREKKNGKFSSKGVIADVPGDFGGMVDAWDISVFNEQGYKETGRVYADYLDFQENGDVNESYYVLTSDNYIYRWDFKKARPYTYNFFANNQGLLERGTDHILYKSVKDLKNDNSFDKFGITYTYPGTPDTELTKSYKIFFEMPDTDLEGELYDKAVAPDPASNLKFVTEVWDGNKYIPGTYVGRGGWFQFDVENATTATLRIEFKGALSSKTYAPVEISQVVTPYSTNRFFWDGRDGNGVIIPAGDYTLVDLSWTVTTKAGEIHFPIVDVEDTGGGFTFTRLSPVYNKDGERLDADYKTDGATTNIYTATKSVIYYDNSAIYYGERVARAGTPESDIILDSGKPKIMALQNWVDNSWDGKSKARQDYDSTRTNQFFVWRDISGGDCTEYKAWIAEYRKENKLRAGDHSHISNDITFYNTETGKLVGTDVITAQKEKIEWLDSAKNPVAKISGSGLSGSVVSDFSIQNFWTFVPGQPVTAKDSTTQEIVIKGLPEGKQAANITGLVFYDNSKDGKYNAKQTDMDVPLAGVTVNLYRQTDDKVRDPKKTYYTVTGNNGNWKIDQYAGDLPAASGTTIYELVRPDTTDMTGRVIFENQLYDATNGTKFAYQVVKPNSTWTLTSGGVKGTPLIYSDYKYGNYALYAYDEAEFGTEIQAFTLGGESVPNAVNPEKNKADYEDHTATAIDVGYNYTPVQSLKAVKSWKTTGTDKTTPANVVYELSYYDKTDKSSKVYEERSLSSIMGWENVWNYLPDTINGYKVEYYISAEYYLVEGTDGSGTLYKHTFELDPTASELTYKSFVGEAQYRELSKEQVAALDYGSYASLNGGDWIDTTTAPAPYTAVLDRNVGAAQTEITITNSDDPGVIEILKYTGALSDKNFLQGATFRLYTNNTGEDITIKQVQDLVSENKLADLEALQVGSATTRENGKVAFAGLDPKKHYVLREVYAPAGYRVMEELYLIHPASCDHDEKFNAPGPEAPDYATKLEEYQTWISQNGRFGADNPDGTKNTDTNFIEFPVGNIPASGNLTVRKRIAGRAWNMEDKFEFNIAFRDTNGTEVIENAINNITNVAGFADYGINIDEGEAAIVGGAETLVRELQNFANAFKGDTDVTVNYSSDNYVESFTIPGSTNQTVETAYPDIHQSFLLLTDGKPVEKTAEPGAEPTYDYPGATLAHNNELSGDATKYVGERVTFPAAGTYTFTISENEVEGGTLSGDSVVYTVVVKVERVVNPDSSSSGTLNTGNSHLEAEVTNITYREVRPDASSKDYPKDYNTPQKYMGASPLFTNDYQVQPAVQSTSYAITKNFTGRLDENGQPLNNEAVDGWLTTDHFYVSITGADETTQDALNAGNIYIGGLHGKRDEVLGTFDTDKWISFNQKDVTNPQHTTTEVTGDVVDEGHTFNFEEIDFQNLKFPTAWEYRSDGDGYAEGTPVVEDETHKVVYYTPEDGDAKYVFCSNLEAHAASGKHEGDPEVVARTEDIVYKLEIKEYKPDDTKGITYSEQVYTLVITLKNAVNITAGDGNLAAAVTDGIIDELDFALYDCAAKDIIESSKPMATCETDQKVVDSFDDWANPTFEGFDTSTGIDWTTKWYYVNNSTGEGHPVIREATVEKWKDNIENGTPTEFSVDIPGEGGNHRTIHIVKEETAGADENYYTFEKLNESKDYDITFIAKREGHTGTHTMTFSNTYEATGTWTPTIHKFVEGRDWGDSESFDFTLTCTKWPGTGNTYKPLNGDSKLTIEKDTGKNDNTGTFGAVTFKAPGTYEFTLSETINLHTNGELKIRDAFTITVTASDEEHNGKLKLTVTGLGGSAEHLDKTDNDNTDNVTSTINFVNAYSESGSFQIAIEKTLTGRDWVEGDSFTFTVTLDEAAKAAVAAGKLTMPTTSGWENASDGSYTVTVKYSDSAEDIADAARRVLGMLNLSDLRAKGGTYVFTVTENMDGFTEKTLECRQPEVKLTVTAYSEEATEGGYTGAIMTYAYLDEDVKDKDDENALKSPYVIPFINKYYVDTEGPKDDEAGTNFTVAKEFTGRPGDKWTNGTKADTFSAAVTFSGDAGLLDNFQFKNGENYVPWEAEYGTVEFSDSSRFKTFDFRFFEAGEYKFTVKEEAGSIAGVTYDENTYTVTFDVTPDHENGNRLTVTRTISGGENVDGGTITFKNTYQATGTWTPKVTKELNGRAWQAGETFEFTLTYTNTPDGVTNPLPTPATISVGKDNAEVGVPFGAVTFTKAGDYTFTITESGKGAGLGTGSTTPAGDITIGVKAEDNGDGTLKLTVTGEGGTMPEEGGSNVATTVKFVNTYDEKGEFPLSLSKLLTGRTWKDSETFSFTITPDEGTKNAIGAGKPITVPSEWGLADASGNYTVKVGETGDTSSTESGWTKQTHSLGKLTVGNLEGKTATYEFTIEEDTSDFEGKSLYCAQPKIKLTLTANGGDLSGALAFSATYAYIVNDGDAGAGGGTSTEQLVLPFTNQAAAVADPTETGSSLTIGKTLTGRNWLAGESYTVALDLLTGEASNVRYSTDGTTYQELSPSMSHSFESTDGTVPGDWKLDFRFFAEGEYVFTVKEQTPEDLRPGVTCDGSTYQVIFTVENVGGKLQITRRADTSGTANDGIVTITNTYIPKPATWTPSVTKVLNGRDWAAHDGFTFDVALKSGVPSGATLGESKISIKDATTAETGASFGNVTFTKPGTYTFTITEHMLDNHGLSTPAGSIKIQVTVTDDPTAGKLKLAFDPASGATETDSDGGWHYSTITEFVNTYSQKPGQFTLALKKTLEGREWTADDGFTFTITPDEATKAKLSALEIPVAWGTVDSATGAYTVTVTLDGSAAAGGVLTKELGVVKVNKPGTYNFTITETGAAGGDTYCPEPVIFLTVNAMVETDAEGVPDGNMVVTTFAHVAGGGSLPHDPDNGDTIVPFTNYAYDEVGLTLNKTYKDTTDNRDKAWADGFFEAEVTLTKADGQVTCNGTALAEGHAVTVPLTKEGAAVTLRFLEAGEYELTVEEVHGAAPGVAYDSTKYTVTVTVTAGSAGKLTAACTVNGEETDDITFENTYTEAPITGGLTVTKRVEGEDTGGSFHFTVTLSDTTVSGERGGMTFHAGAAEFYLGHDEAITATGLPAGVTYAVTETKAEGYTTTSTGASGRIPASGSVTAAFVNTKGTVPPPPVGKDTGGLTVTKTVTGAAGETDREWHFTVTLEGDGANQVSGVYDGVTFTGGKAEFTLRHGQSKTFLDLPAGLSYTVVETEAGQDGYETSASSERGTIPGGGAATAAFINHRDEKTGPTGGLSVSKTVAGTAGETGREWHFTVELSGDGANQVSGVYDGVTFTGGKAEFTLQHGQSKTFPGLPAGLRYTVTENVTYANDYTTSSVGWTGEIPENRTAAAVFTNTKNGNPAVGHGFLTVAKTVTGNLGERDREFTFTVTLSDTSISDEYSGVTFENGVGTFTLKDGESITFELPAGTAYTVGEGGAEGYTVFATGWNGTIAEGDTVVAAFVNDRQIPLGDLKITKTVTGSAGDRTREWHFHVALDDKSVSGVYGGVTFTDGEADVTLKHGESVTLTDLPAGTAYTVTEQEANRDGYTTTAAGQTGHIPENGIIEAGFTNYKPNDPPPTPPGPGGPGKPDVEIDDRDHYAYIIGKPGGIVDPDGQITRAEIATVIFRLLKEEVREEYWSKVNTFPDVQITDWYNNAISTLENLGIVNGKDDGLFHPDDPITRAEMAAMMARLYDYDLNTGDFHTKFDDIDPNAWYARYVKAAEDLGLFLGDGATNHFYPNRSLTRAEAMTVYNRLLDRKPHRDGLLPPEQMILWPDNMDTGAWYYADVQEATNSHTCAIDGLAVDDKTYERWLEPLPVRDWAALERAWSEAHSGYDGHDVN